MAIMKDNGFCLSMHQPWASLLVLGIKKHEGRSWYSAHRGPLWISAASKQPEQSEIEKVEQFYIDRGFEKSIFPSSYPTSCILGSVNVIDVLPLTNYLEQFPEGESSCPFVFICDNPRELLFKLPMKGKHKICQFNLKSIILFIVVKLDADIFRSVTSSFM
ncbi:Activating signal cointegrator 1 [Cichlidogyrus casuarinus]|uniref:Activating signal cointegrator 1 n=1 Tax=Cichlidogyrus casuarinus TaxID=1844966 RepID=A0ABD2QPM5_9PLAT